MTPSRPALLRPLAPDHARRAASAVLVVSLAASLAPATALGAQGATSTTLDGGAALLSQDNTERVVAPTLGVDWRRDAVRSTLRASAAGSAVSSERWAVQGLGAGSWFFGTAYAPREFGTTLSLLRLIGVPTAVTGGLLARQHLSRGDVGGWLGAGVAFAARGPDLGTVASLEGAVWRGGPNWRTTFSVSTVTAGVDSARTVLSLPATRFSALDVVGGAEWRLPHLELAGNLGLRSSRWRGGDGVPSSIAALALATAVVPLRPALSVVLSAGNQYADPIRGTPAVRHVALSLRIRPSALRPQRPQGPPAGGGLPMGGDNGVSAGTEPAAATSLLVVAGEGGARILRVTAPRNARRVELRASATGWQSLELLRRGDHWEAIIALEPGTHRVMLRVDGGPWLPPGNLPAVDDDFGGRVGLLVVP